MTNHPNRAARFHLLRPVTTDTTTFQTEYAVVSRHRSLAAAVSAGEALHHRESRERLPHRTPTTFSEFIVRDITTGAEHYV